MDWYRNNDPAAPYRTCHLSFGYRKKDIFLHEKFTFFGFFSFDGSRIEPIPALIIEAVPYSTVHILYVLGFMVGSSE